MLVFVSGYMTRFYQIFFLFLVETNYTFKMTGPQIEINNKTVIIVVNLLKIFYLACVYARTCVRMHVCM